MEEYLFSLKETVVSLETDFNYYVNSNWQALVIKFTVDQKICDVSILYNLCKFISEFANFLIKLVKLVLFVKILVFRV